MEKYSDEFLATSETCMFRVDVCTIVSRKGAGHGVNDIVGTDASTFDRNSLEIDNRGRGEGRAKSNGG